MPDLTHLNFPDLVKVIQQVNDELKRCFYEIEAIRGGWSVKELKRQINSLYYERSGLSENKEKLAELAQTGVERQSTLSKNTYFIPTDLNFKRSA